MHLYVSVLYIYIYIYILKPCFVLVFSFQTRDFIFLSLGTSQTLEDLLKAPVYIYAGKHLCIYVYLSCTLVVSDLNIHV